jgi:Flp pilus assembly protein TadD
MQQASSKLGSGMGRNMPIFGFTLARAATLLVAATIAGATPAVAQSVVAETPGTALSRHIRILAANPRDFNALIGAGRAALELGDVQAATGFFGRAEEVNPNAPAAKAGLGAAMAHMGDADGAIFYFDQALKLGAQPMTVAADRGMARDLLGELGSAQADYRLAINSLGSDEARRRLALSLAISRDRKGALDAIQPLLNRRDPAAQRTRAFVLALTGDQVGAAQAIESMMPGGAARFAPFFRYLPNLSITEKAAAVHLGVFPENAATRIAQAQPVPQPPATLASPPKVAVGRPAPAASQPVRKAPEAKPAVRLATRHPVVSKPAPSFSLPSNRTAAASPSFSLPSVTNTPPSDKGMTPVDSGEPLEPAPVLAEIGNAEPEGNLTGIDKLLATLAEAPPPAQPKLELKKPAMPASSDKTAKAAAAKKAAEKKARDEKLAAERKAREEAAKLGVKGTYWVQLAGGSNQDRMTVEYKKLSAKAGKLLKSRSGYVTEGKDYFRLLVGPFDSKSDSQAFVNKLEKEGVDGFSWTRTPAKIRIEKL